MAYAEIQQAAFLPNLEVPFTRTVHTLAFPAAWRDPILDLYTYGRTESAKAKIKSVPIRRLNSLMRVVAPDLITVGAYAAFDENKPWIYAEEPYPPRVLSTMINAWLRNLKPTDEAYQQFLKTARSLAAHQLEWQVREIDLREQSTSPGGTAVPHDHLYRLVPEIVADRIAQLDPYEHAGHQVTFHRVAVDARASGAELMSWPPLEHPAKAKGTSKVAYYSGVIRVSLRTVPFSPVPRVQISTGIRRWVSGPVYFPGTNGVSTYLLAKDPFVEAGTRPRRFAVAMLEWDRKARRPMWRQGGPEGLLTQVSAVDNLPSPDVFAKEPEAWLRGDDLQAAVTFHGRMRWHAVGTGLMPLERRRLTEWAAQALEPEFTWALPLLRSDLKQNPARVLEKKVPVPKEKQEGENAEQRERAQLENLARDKRNAEKRRSLAAATNDNNVSAVLFHQTKEMRQHIVDAIEKSLALAEHRREAGPELYSWESRELTVRLHTRSLGSLGGPLGDNEKAPRSGKEFDEAIRQRREQVKTAVAALCDSIAERPPLVLVELEGPDKFPKPRTDPKFAIRLGCADAGAVSQFIRPPDLEAEEDDAEFRAEAAWGDGLRQLGMRFIPEHTLGDAIPKNLNQLAFWLVKRRVDGPTQKAQFTPVAVLSRPGQDCIMGRTADMTAWVPYPELLRSLTGLGGVS
ncbi:pPIWI_RE module domain-containing protein [Saccharothrix carnea]